MNEGKDPMRDLAANELLLRFGYEMTVSCAQPTPMICLLDAHEENAPNMREPEVVTCAPDVPMHTYKDGFGNVCRRFVAPVGDFTIRSNGVIITTDEVDPADWSAPEIPVQDLPDEVIQFLVGSRYCETDKMSQLAWDTFGYMSPGYSRVQAIVDWSKQRLHFDYQQARSTRTALDAFYEQVGVCRDFAHLAITICRCLNIPARYVNGYLGDIRIPQGDSPMDFSAWMEVYLGGQWWTFDPRNNQRRVGRIVIARGRDAADVPLINSFGQHWLKKFEVWTDEI